MLPGWLTELINARIGDRMIFNILLLLKNEYRVGRPSFVFTEKASRMSQPASSGGEDSDWTSSSGESSADSSTDKEETHRLLILVQEYC
jgi:hypothetical protein